MSMTRTLLTLVLLAALGACGRGGKDEVDNEDASRTLEHQRTEVRQAARDLVIAAEKHLPGTTRNSSSGFRGCESSFSEEFRTFHYLAQARIDTGPGSAASYLETLRPVLDGSRNEFHLVKRRYSGFIGTEFDIVLRGLKADTLILVGGLTDVCVHYTFADAHQRDFHVRVVEDCVGGSTVPAHEASLDAMEYLQAGARRTTDEIVAAFAALGGRGELAGVGA